MLAAKLPTLMKTAFDNLSRSMAKRFVKFAEAEIGGLGGKNPRYSIKRIEEALDFCCDHPEALHYYQTITEARKALNQK
jgi:hypothetical protein